MKHEIDLNILGIDLPINLYGSHQILRPELNLPVVFLIDEIHDNTNNCIEKNVENARELIDIANVKIIGVESMAGGRRWDYETECYDEDEYHDKYYAKEEKEFRGGNTLFADGVRAYNQNIVFGVESIGMSDTLERKLLNQEISITEVKDSPINKARSRHFIRTLFDYWKSNSKNGNLILNCGADHNSHFEEWINNGEIDNIAGVKAAYVRLNTYN